MKKVFPNRTRIIIYLTIVTLIVGALLFWFLKDLFLKQWDFIEYLIVFLFVLLAAVFYFFTIKTTYYVINNDSVSFFRLGKELRYYFKDIVYVDESKGDKTKTIGFHTRQKRTIYLTGDKNLEIYNALLNKSKNRLSLEDFKKQYPNVNV